MPSWLITGTSRGIGLALAGKLLEDESNVVIATARNIQSEGLQELHKKYPSRIHLVELDITSDDSVKKAVEAATPHLPNGIDYFVNNAGINSQPVASFEELDLDKFAYDLNFTTVGAVRVTRAFLPLVKKSELKRILFITSVVAASKVAGWMVEQYNAYTVAKASLNSLAHKWGSNLKGSGVITAAIHPGWSQTPLGEGINEWMTTNVPHLPHFKPEDAAQNVINISSKLTLENTGLFWDFDGKNLEF